MKMKIYRDAAGAVLNIGEWAFIECDGKIANPIPPGATVADEDVETGSDGSRYVVDGRGR